MNEGTLSGKSTIRLLGISAERPTNGLYLTFTPGLQSRSPAVDMLMVLPNGMRSVNNRGACFAYSLIINPTPIAVMQ
jgi:hypothetical protein